MKTVAVVELGLMAHMVPLLGGYLEAYAKQDSHLNASYTFVKHSAMTRVGRAALLDALLRVDAPIYAFSCYVWNFGLILQIVRDLLASRPGAQIMLGGPQVMNQADRILTSALANVAICNGEGEATFADYLRELTESQPDFSRVDGISFMRDGEIVTTARRQRLERLDTIPSPFLGGLFDGRYWVSILETNRGCPFRCSFCYWGAATNDRVHYFDVERTKEEMRWLSRHGVPALFIADANWGLSKRDVELSRHIAACHAEYGSPKGVYLAGAAKNSPERVSEIVEIFDTAGIVTAQPVSLQSLDERTLETIDRRNIKRDAFARVQRSLDSRHVSSFTELMWPLPGETLDTFRRGIAELCRSGGNAHTIVVFPVLLLVNTPMHRRQTEHGLATRRIGDGTCESDLVVATNQVSEQEYRDGLTFYYATLLLYNMRALRLTLRYLDRTGLARADEVLGGFARSLFAHDNELVRFIESVSIGKLEAGVYSNYGKVVHHGLHQHRDDLRNMVRSYLASTPYWQDDRVRLMFELDRVLLPYVYSSTTLDVAPETFELLRVELGDRTLSIEVDERFDEPYRDALALYGFISGEETRACTVDHRREQPAYSSAFGLGTQAEYCAGVLLRSNRIVPRCVPGRNLVEAN
jgi:radical SAM superfamily enzyme YgiQ (UPF0313 family)